MGKRESQQGTYANKQEAVSEDLKAAADRAQSLSNRLASAAERDDLALEAVEELRITLEELLVADAELRQQTEAVLIARQQLEDERAKYEELFESAPGGYVVTDENGLILKVNRMASEMLGVGPSFLTGKPLASYVDHADHKHFRTEINRLINSNSTFPRALEVRISPRNLQCFEASLSISPTRTRDNVVTELRWLIRDISELKQSTERIRVLNTELERRVKERTAELEQANVFKDELLKSEQRARAEAEAANRSKDEFLAIVSHELRTPLNAILGWAQLIRQNVESDQRIHAAEVIERSARAQARLINDILDVSRVISGGLPLDKRPLDLAKTIEAAIEAARPSIEAKGILLRVELDYSAGVIIGDATRVQQIVGNILSNSTKFTPRKGTIAVKLEKSGGDFRISVSDSGYGITPEFLPYVFDRFRQGDSQVNRQKGGMGLGLAIVKFLAELHGGTVEAASEGLEKGATFTVILPGALQVSGLPEKTNADDQPVDLSPISNRLMAMWVVVVDDDYDAREMMRAVLEDAGARVTTCNSYEEAFALFNERSTAALTPKLPDVLVADIAMPGYDGFDLIRAIRRLEPARGGDIPAIALTAYADEDTRKRALKEGYQKYLTKPLVLEELVNSIATLDDASAIIQAPPSTT
jgi:PAS domain S-box-containing protein